MRLLFFITIGVLSTSLLSSCLKDTPYLSLGNTTPILEFGQSAANNVYGYGGYYGAFAFAGDTAGPAVTDYDTAIALVLASPQVLNDTIAVTIAIDQTQIAPYNTAEDTNYTLIPQLNGADSLYSLPLTVIKIAPGYRIGNIPVTIHLENFPNPHHFALPITITKVVDEENPSNTIIISGNSGQFMWLFN